MDKASSRPSSRAETSQSWGTDEEDSSLLHKAVRDRRLHQFRLLMSLGVDVDKKDPHGRTPMMVATTMEPEEFGLKLMKMCIKHNANVNEQDKHGRSVLGYTCINGREKMAKCLLQNSCHDLVKNLPDENGDIPLNLAAAYGHDVIVKGLIKSLQKDGLPVDVRNKQGCTALILAAKNGHYKCAQVLLEDGSASANLRDDVYFMSPLEWAKYSQSHFERGLKLMRVISVPRSTQSEMLNVHTPAWCDDKQVLHELPALTLVTSQERPNFQKKKQLIAQLRTRQTQLSSLVGAIEPKIPEKVSYSRKASLRDSNVDHADTMRLESEAEGESVPYSALHSRCKTFPPANGPRPNTPSYLSSLFKIYEGNVGIRPSQHAKKQEIVPIAVETTTTMDEEEEAEIEAAAAAYNAGGRRKSKAGISQKRHSMHTMHGQNLPIPIRKSKSMTTN